MIPHDQERFAKSVPIAVIVTILIQTGTIIW